MVAKISALPVSKATGLYRYFCAGADVSEPNAQGRILIPDHLRQHACLEKEAVIIGCGTRVEIWNREKWEAYNDEENYVDQVLAERMAELHI